MSSGNAADFLLEGKAPDAVALRMLDGNHTYGEVLRAMAAAASLVAHAIERGGRVLLLADNSLFWVASYLGTMKAGAIAVPLPPAISPADLAYVAAATGARLAFVQSKLRSARAAEFKDIEVLTERDLSGSPAEEGLPPVDPEEVAALMFTSGSTGRPRGVMVTHANIMANTASIVEYLELNAADQIMTVLPFHYCFGTSLLHTHLKVGASLVIDSRFLYPEAIVERMAETECTGFAGVPSHFQILLLRSSLKKREFPRLRYVQQAGGHLGPAFVRELREALPRTRIYIMYGQTEATARLAYLAPEFLDSKPGSVGKAIPGVRLRVLNPAGEEVAAGEVGEVVAEGANVARGYWGEPEESAKCFRDGRLYTGDLGRLDEDGFLYLVDRCKDFLKCGGVRAGARQIEDRLLECDGLLEAAVVGIADEYLGEAVKAFVVRQERGCPGACQWTVCRDARERVMQFCREHMAGALVPREVVMMPALPKNSAGKIDKPGLKTL